MVVVPQSPSFSIIFPSAGARATTHTPSAAVSASSQSAPSVTSALAIWFRYARSAGSAASAGKEAKHQQLGKGASRYEASSETGAPARGLEVEEAALAVRDVRIVGARVAVHQPRVKDDRTAVGEAQPEDVAPVPDLRRRVHLTPAPQASASSDSAA